MAKVYIGVGHGGSDPGAVSGAHREAAYALDIATACAAELLRYGVQVMQSRTTNVTESAAAKIKECNACNPDIALDIHLNAGKGDGFEIYHSITGGKGKILAQRIEAAVKAIGQNSRGVKTRTRSDGKDHFGFIRQTKCPGVLVECAFIDSTDVGIVDTLIERQAMGVAVARGILTYFGIAVKVQTPVASAAASGGSAKRADVSVTLPTLARGDKGESVRALQHLLIAYGYSCGEAGADGDFGSDTEAAVGKYQTANKLTADGVVGAKTWSDLLK